MTSIRKRVRPQKTIKTEGEVTRTRRRSYSGEEVDNDQAVARVPFDFEHGRIAKLRIGGGHTIQPAQYEALRVDVHVEIPVQLSEDGDIDKDKESMSEAYDIWAEWLDKTLAHEVDEAYGRQGDFSNDEDAD